MNAISKITADADIPGTLAPGIYEGISNDAYHSGPGVSKTGLWTIYTETPAHYKFGVREEKNHFDVGTAIDNAILEPELFESQVMKGPADRRGNNWKDAVAEAANLGKLLLTAGDYEEVQTIRDAIHADPWINAIITNSKAVVQQSAYALDPVTGVLIRCRPDLRRPDLGLMIDLKSARSAHPAAFARAVLNYGYHAQEAFYTDTWNSAVGAIREPDQYVTGEEDDDGYAPTEAIKGQAIGGVEAFCFLVVEKKPPYAFAVYELPPAIVEEGRAAMRKALNTYAECVAADQWPAYQKQRAPIELDFKHWAYRETAAPVGEDA